MREGTQNQEKQQKRGEDRNFLILRDKAQGKLVKVGKKDKILMKYMEDNFIQGVSIHESKWVQSKNNFPKG